MDIISYRGPDMAGGVSTGLARVWQQYGTTDNLWWHTSQSELRVLPGAGCETRPIRKLPKNLIDGHYRYCNEYLWPIMHDLDQFATYSELDRASYRSFNRMIAEDVARIGDPDRYQFVQDYQFALLPGILQHQHKMKCAIFWHIPWPKKVREQHISALAEIATSMLASEVIGFHTQEYADSFMSFVTQHVEGYACDRQRGKVVPTSSQNSPQKIELIRKNHLDYLPRLMTMSRSETSIIVAPLGLDIDHWSNLLTKQAGAVWLPFLEKTRYVLSIDRADYTKGVDVRLEAIDQFFALHPQHREKITFIQMCGRTRSGISSFDNYWSDCRKLEARVNENWKTDDWQPIVWVENSHSSADLALLYQNAAAMLVTPVRDGLNLTAKEFVACQTHDPGVLILSPGAGAWHELSEACLRADIRDPRQMAKTIATALEMGAGERALRMELLKQKLKENTLTQWWSNFQSMAAERGRDVEIPSFPHLVMPLN